MSINFSGSGLVRTDRNALLRPLELMRGIIERECTSVLLQAGGRTSKAGTSKTAAATDDAAIVGVDNGAPVAAADDDDDGDSDPDSDRRRKHRITLSPHTALELKPVITPTRTRRMATPKVPKGRSCITINELIQTDLKHTREINLVALTERTIFNRRAHWMALSLTICAFGLSVFFAMNDKDWLSAMVLTEPVAVLIAGFLQSRELKKID